jgi:hypothetical protein
MSFDVCKVGISREYADASLGDARRSQRLVALGCQLAKNPALSFPKAMKSEARLEGAYRFLSNASIDPGAMLAPHTAATRKRARKYSTVLAIHDTTEFVFSGLQKRRGLGTTNTKNQGFFCHSALLVAPGEARLPLGVAAVQSWSREGKRTPMHTSQRTLDPKRESVRWIDQALNIEDELQHGALVHIMDREADFFELLSRFVTEKVRFVVRAMGNRKVQPEDVAERLRIAEIPGTLRTRCTRTVPVSRRSKKKQPGGSRYHRPRIARKARLSFSASKTTVTRPAYAPSEFPEQISVNLVCVHEEGAPRGEQSVDWVLLTSEPIETRADILQIVDFYRARWTVEEFFKALKSGCSFEQRQLESLAALRRALALFVPIAWRLLLLRSLARSAPGARLSRLLDCTLISVLRVVSPVPLPKSPTVREGLAAVAAMGGHLKRNGEPGWQTLADGYHQLLFLAVGWKAREM